MVDNNSYIENGINEILFTYAKELNQYANYLTKEKNYSREELYKVLQTLKIYYNKLSMILKKGVFAITPSDIENINDYEHIKYLRENFYPDGSNEIANFQSFLLNDGLISTPNIFYEDPVITQKKNLEFIYHRKPRHFKAIQSLDKISYYYPFNELPHAKRTIDGRITITKKKLIKNGEFTYLFYDHIKDDYIKDQNGNDIEIKSFADAKQFVKELYKANWEEWRKAPLPDEKPRE